MKKGKGNQRLDRLVSGQGPKTVLPCPFFRQSRPPAQPEFYVIKKGNSGAGVGAAVMVD